MTDEEKTDQSSKDEAARSIWDNDLPAGESPALSRWPFTVSILAYSVWMVILISMLIVRLCTTG
ncbi:MAG: hypothetical protein ACYTF1_09955 [Planctomycetota bacterium]